MIKRTPKCNCNIDFIGHIVICQIFATLGAAPDFDRLFIVFTVRLECEVKKTSGF